MWQKNIISGFLIILSCMFTQAYAQTVEVSSLDKFSTDSPPKSISIKLLEPLEISDNEVYKAGVIMKGDLFDVVSPKRLKRDADFSFKPVSYTDENGKTYQINSNITASYTEPLNKDSEKWINVIAAKKGSQHKRIYREVVKAYQTAKTKQLFRKYFGKSQIPAWDTTLK